MTSQLRSQRSLSAAGIACLGVLLVDLGPVDSYRVEVVRSFGEEAAIGQVMDIAVAPDGSAYVVDASQQQILHFDASGELLGRIGRGGGGPGEFRTPYRATVGTDGSLFVVDFATAEVSRFSDSGAFETRSRLPFVLFAIDRIVALPSGELAISGVTGPNSPGEGFAIHLFNRKLEHLRSFGPLPTALNAEVLRYWGAGGLTLKDDSTLLYSRRIPYTVHTFRRDAVEIARFEAPFDLKKLPDDEIRIQRSATDYSISSSKQPITRPVTAYELEGGVVLAGRAHVSTGMTLWDVFSPDGKLLGTIEPPAGVKSILALDRSRNVLWASGERDLEPVLFQIRIIREAD